MKISKLNKFIIFYSLFTLSLQQGSEAAGENDPQQITPPEKKPVSRAAPALADLEGGASRGRSASLSKVTSPLSPSTSRKLSPEKPLRREDMITPLPRQSTTPRGSQTDLSEPYVSSASEAKAGARSESPTAALARMATSPLSPQERVRLGHRRSSSTGTQGITLDHTDRKDTQSPRSVFSPETPTPQEEKATMERKLAALYATHIQLLSKLAPESKKTAHPDEKVWAQQKIGELQKEVAEDETSASTLHDKVQEAIDELTVENDRIEDHLGKSKKTFTSK